MREKTGIAAFVLTMFFVSVLASECLASSEVGSIDDYKNGIEEQIAKCYAKIRFIDSSSKNLRRYCQRELRKAEFFSRAKKLLLMQMIDNRIGVKDYKIQYFLNSRFYETVSE